MTKRITRRGAPLVLCGLIAFGMVPIANAAPDVSCEQAGRTAEQAYGLPPGLLLAIGRVESGRWDAQLDRVVAWPWSIDVNGRSHQFSSGRDAIAAVRTLQASGSTNIDIGCFQINLSYHPEAFPSLEQAFDPQANAQYAARFLSSLRVRFGNWQDAVAAYHSATPDLGLPYRQRVFAAWTGNPGDALVSGPEFTVIAGVRIWVPSATSTGSQTIVGSATLPPALPHIITPSR
jgi:hypothetical protein